MVGINEFPRKASQLDCLNSTGGFVISNRCVFVCAMLTVLACVPSAAQDSSAGLFKAWEDRVRDTLAQQPSWPIPLVTASSGLLQVARTDFVRQIAPAGTDTWNYGNTKGVNVVPWYKIEFD